jgi:hypothetical protein
MQTRLRLFVALLCLSAAAFGTTVLPPKFDDLVNQADYIIWAVVRSVTPFLRTTTDGKKIPYSRVELEVKEVVAGTPPVQPVLEVLGGTYGGRELAISGAPKFVVGEESILFVQGNGHQIFPLVRMMHGMYLIRTDETDGRKYVARSDEEPLRSLDQVAEPMSKRERTKTLSQLKSEAMTPDDFVQKIRAHTKQSRLLDR